MGQSVVIDPSGDPSRDSYRPSLQAYKQSVGDRGVVSKKSSSYICQFCGRLCRNAQALGGHMNVHRRERALAKELVALRNQGSNLKGTRAPTAGDVGVAATAIAALGKPQVVEEGEQNHQDEIIHGGLSSASSSSPPSACSIAIASTLVHPWKSLHQLPSKNHKRQEGVDLELRLGFTSAVDDSNPTTPILNLEPEIC